MSEQSLRSRSAFENLDVTRSGADVEVAELTGVVVASMMLRRNRRADCSARARDLYGLELAQGPRRSAGGGLELLGVGPDSWLAITRDLTFADLVQAFGEVAAVCEQSASYGLVTLSGSRSADVLSKLAPIDFHPSVFPAGAVSATRAGHIPTIIWRRDEKTFSVAVFRSYCRSFAHALSNAINSCGLHQKD